MSNEPKAGKGIDPEMLAAYIDKRLPPDERAAVEAQLATDPQSYELLVELVAAQEALGEDAEPKVPEVPRAVVPMVPKVRASRWVLAGGVLATAAALVLVVRMQPDLLNLSRRAELDRVVEAVGPARHTDARVTGGFQYGPRVIRQRAGNTVPASEWALLGVVTGLEGETGMGAQHALGVGYLMLGRTDEAIALLARVAGADARNADAAADYAAALTERALSTRAPADLNEARAALDRALQIDSRLREPLFNRALVLTALSDPAAQSAWQAYLSVDSSGPWAEQARRQMNGIPRPR
jgi:tetratricopeptide (TPR) repeat protein